MDKTIIAELENYMFKHETKPTVAAYVVADIIGVMIGIKPATVINHINTTESSKQDPNDLIELLNRANLKALFFTQSYFSMGKIIWSEDVYISHDIRVAAKLHQLFEKLRDSMDNMGQIFDQGTWEESSRKIGHLLGYPTTAVEYFITEQDIDNEERKQLMKRYQFYVHSPKHHEEEYRAHDYKIIQALQDYAPKSAKILIDSKDH